MANEYCLGQISDDVNIDCDNLLTRGLEQRAVIINRSDIDFDKLKYDVARKNIVTDLLLKTGARGYECIVPTQQPYQGTGTTLGDGTVRKTFTNTFGLIVLDNSPDVCAKVIDGLANGQFVVVFENKFKNIQKATTPGDSTFQIMGIVQGLVATEISEDKWSTDTDGGWNIVLTEEGVPKSGIFLFDTDLATTRTIFDSLTEAEG